MKIKIDDPHTKKKSSHIISIKADSRLAPSQWETSLQSNGSTFLLGANLESALTMSHSVYILLIMSQLITQCFSQTNTCEVYMWKVISNSLDIDFIHRRIHAWACKNTYQTTTITRHEMFYHRLNAVYIFTLYSGPPGPPFTNMV